MEGGTVKQFLDALEEMRTIYPYKDEETRLSTRNAMSYTPDTLTIITKDEKTGIIIEMSKVIPREV